ncbi:hypothetical protein C8J57DRAFT_1518392 [Mycena rebaudengoi]|nr:hypothetical protein C8J57DRAFT_1518392 [Mycena rebaudengoi]
MPRSLIQLRFGVYRALLKWNFALRGKEMGTGHTEYQRNQVAELSARKAVRHSLLEYHDAVAASSSPPNLCRELSIYRAPTPTIYTPPASFEINFRDLPIPVFHQAAHHDQCTTLYFNVCAHCYQNQRTPFRDAAAAQKAWASTNGPQAEIARFYHQLFCKPLQIEVL